MRTLALALTLVLSLSVSVPARAAVDETNANRLNALGLFLGTGSGYDLGGTATRLHGIIMLTRMLGEEDAALSFDGPCPFSDVAAGLSQGDTPYEILDSQLSGRVLDLSGCSVSMILYYLSEGYPVLAMQGGGNAELITGYDPQNIIVTDPLTGESSKRGMNDSTQQYVELGNLFLVCLPEMTE